MAKKIAAQLDTQFHLTGNLKGVSMIGCYDKDESNLSSRLPETALLND